MAFRQLLRWRRFRRRRLLLHSTSFRVERAPRRVLRQAARLQRLVQLARRRAPVSVLSQWALLLPGRLLEGWYWAPWPAMRIPPLTVGCRLHSTSTLAHAIDHPREIPYRTPPTL